MRITVVFESDRNEPVKLTVDPKMSIKEVSDLVDARFSGVSYIAFN